MTHERFTDQESTDQLEIFPVAQPLTATEMCAHTISTVRSQGDVIDVLANRYASGQTEILKGYGYVTATLVADAAALFVHSGPVSQRLNVFATLGPVSAVGLLGASYATAVIRNNFLKKEVSRQAVISRELTGILDEPVDVYRSGTKKDGYTTVLRWYGADEAEKTKGNETIVAARLQKLLSRRGMEKLDKVAFSADWIQDAGLKSDISTFGTLTYGKTFTDYLGKDKPNQAANVDTAIMAEQVIIADIAQCRKLIAEFGRNNHGPLQDKLALQIAELDLRSGVPEQYELWKASGKQQAAMKTLIRRLESEVSHGLQRYVESDPITERTENGTNIRLRTSDHVQVRGDKVTTIQSYTDTNGNPHLDAGQGSKSLLTMLSTDSIDSLVSKVDDTVDADKASLYAKAALLTVLSRHAEDVTVAVDSDVDETVAVSGQTTVQRMESMVMARKTWRKKPESPITIIDSGNNVRGRFLTGMTVALTGAVATLAGGLYVSDRFEDVKDRFADEYKQSATADAASFARYVQDQPWLDRVSSNIVINGTDALNAFQRAMPYQVSPVAPSTGSAEGTDTDAYSGINPTSVGDVSLGTSDSLQIVYNIESFGTADPAGYWTGQVNNTMRIDSARTQPFSDASISFENEFNDAFPEDFQDLPLVAMPVTPVVDSQISYKISTDTIGGIVEMPVKTGNRMIAANLTRTSDSTGQNETVAIPVYQHRDTGTYTAHFKEDFNKGYSNERLTYWLAPSLWEVRAAEPLRPTANIDMETVADATSAALDLPTLHTGKDVIKAIVAKDYSRQPFQNSRIRDIETGFTGSFKTDETAAAKVIGETFARTPMQVCNTAAATLILATAGNIDGDPVNYASGFLNSADTPTTLVVGEAHAWALGASGVVYDATPPDRYPDPPKQEDDDMLAIVGAAGSVGVLALAGFGLFKMAGPVRRRIRRSTSERALLHLDTRDALNMYEIAAYSKDPHTAVANHEQWIDTMNQIPAERRIRSLPIDLAYQDTEQLFADKGIRLRRRTQRGMRKLIKQRTTIESLVTEEA